MKIYKKMIACISLLSLTISSAYSFEIGVGTHISHYPGNAEKYIHLMNEYGFTSFRDGISWNSVEEKKGEMSIPVKNTPLDQIYLKDDSAATKNAMFVLAYGNKNYTDNGRPKTKQQADKFVDYATWIAQRYKGRVKYYEIWNEWLVQTGVKKGDTVPDDDIYLYLVEQSAKAIKEVDPNAIVVAGSLNPIYAEQVNWITKLVQRGFAKNIDGISIHPYTYYERKRPLLMEPSADMDVIDAFEKRISASAGRAIPIYITEMGYPTTSAIPGGVTQVQAAKYIYEYTALAKQRGYIKGVWWYDLIDDGLNPNNKEHNFGMFKQDLTPKSSAKLIRQFAPQLMSNASTVELNSQKEVIIHNKGNSHTLETFSSK
ncbi:cellulase family glycosylhydrolase [Klebsiella aerogenes]|uniref:cellulase family glycosylhydrolase n=1 Tax=Klebsiella aerogenes TaxID=548 RepID=UPI000698F18C|nr:cellulase family glycosylhydrolase [Klebsiella aerogenes]UNX75332.1 glycoside hydrolase family 5 protein [Klebsiella aerogenes]HCD3926537.1 cellulase family glycosylhydrolase [Klebsiella aerogenes]